MVVIRGNSRFLTLANGGNDKTFQSAENLPLGHRFTASFLIVRGYNH